MVQRVAKYVVTPEEGAPDRGVVVCYIEGTDGDEGGVKITEAVTFADFFEGNVPGDFLVGDFPEIDLPTT